jgi:type I restriction-modification system DNA methylase subunit
MTAPQAKTIITVNSFHDHSNSKEGKMDYEKMVIRHATVDDIPGVRALLKKYHRDTISDEDRPNGFVTTAITDEQLTQLIEEENGVMIITDPKDDGPDDVLGDVYMKAEMGSKAAGQFFTPFHLSELCAKLGLDEDRIRSEEKITVNEPSTGGGGMIIATAKVLKDNGINYQKKMEVVAQDLDWLGVFMSYVQFSFLGINAIVVQGDTLMEPYVKGYPEARVFRTPANKGVLI